MLLSLVHRQSRKLQPCTLGGFLFGSHMESLKSKLDLVWHITIRRFTPSPQDVLQDPHIPAFQIGCSLWKMYRFTFDGPSFLLDDIDRGLRIGVAVGQVGTKQNSRSIGLRDELHLQNMVFKLFKKFTFHCTKNNRNIIQYALFTLQLNVVSKTSFRRITSSKTVTDFYDVRQVQK